MDDNNDLDFGAFFIGALLGGLVGAAAGLLLAPQSGEETRMLIHDKGIEIRDKVNESAVAAREQAEALAREAKSRAESMQRRGQVVLEEQKTKLDTATKTGK